MIPHFSIITNTLRLYSAASTWNETQAVVPRVVLCIWGPSHQVAYNNINLRFLCDKVAGVQNSEEQERSTTFTSAVIRFRCSNLRIRGIATGGVGLGYGTGDSAVR